MQARSAAASAAAAAAWLELRLQDAPGPAAQLMLLLYAQAVTVQEFRHWTQQSAWTWGSAAHSWVFQAHMQPWHSPQFYHTCLSSSTNGSSRKCRSSRRLPSSSMQACRLTAPAQVSTLQDSRTLTSQHRKQLRRRALQSSSACRQQAVPAHACLQMSCSRSRHCLRNRASRHVCLRRSCCAIFCAV